MHYFGHLRTVVLLLIAITTTTLTTSVTSTSWNGKKLTTTTNTIMTQFRKRNHRHNNRLQPPVSSSSSSSFVQSIKSTTHTQLQHPLLTSIPPSGSTTICDSNTILFSKIGIAILFETISLTSILLLARHYDRNTNISSIIPRWKGLSLLSWALLFVVVFASSFIGAFIDGGLSAATNQVLDPNVVPGEPNWYANLNRPWWEPPGWVFPIMWLIVSKPTQLVALSRLLKTTNDDKQSLIGVVLGVYSAHLSLGDAWNKVFFGYQCIGRGVVVITLFFGVLLASAVLFGRVDEGAGRWLVPTCGWVAIATCLNWSIYFRNKK